MAKTIEELRKYKREHARARRAIPAVLEKHRKQNREYMRRNADKAKLWRKKFKDANPLYDAWKNIVRRTSITKHATEKEIKNYSSRGIRICDEWATNYKAFEAWALANGWHEGLELDRIDNDGNYEPSNCRFVTHTQNNRNKRNTIFVLWQGRREKFVEVWSQHREKSVSYSCALSRLKMGWPLERAITQPPKV